VVQGEDEHKTERVGCGLGVVEAMRVELGLWKKS
jgi:hypothetical protein